MRLSRFVLPLGILFTTLTASGMGMIHKSVPHQVPVVTQETYLAAEATKRPLFLAYNADWCPVCQKQNQVLSEVSSRFKDRALFYTVDWDKRNEFKGPVTKQRTTIAFVKEGKIADELIGETDADKIEDFINRHVK